MLARCFWLSKFEHCKTQQLQRRLSCKHNIDRPMASLAFPAQAVVLQRHALRIAMSWIERPAALQRLQAHAALPALGALALGMGTSLVHDLWDSILRAVPKKKTTHSKTRMRSATKGLKDKFNINNCSACGQPKLANALCGTCFREIRHRWAKEASRAAGIGSA
jgi:large subunit ribosomal protein L32